VIVHQADARGQAAALDLAMISRFFRELYQTAVQIDFLDTL
jgi:hypothetical protein